MTASIIAATTIMYIRILVISSIFNLQVAKTILLPFLFFLIVSAIITYIYYKKASNTTMNILIHQKLLIK